MTPHNEVKFRAILSEIADVAIQDDANRAKTGIPTYDEGDLINATIIFQHVFSVLAIRRMIGELEFVESCERAEQIGKEFRDYILKWTGIDMWDVEKPVL